MAWASTVEEAVEAAKRIGYEYIMVKARAFGSSITRKRNTAGRIIDIVKLCFGSFLATPEAVLPVTPNHHRLATFTNMKLL
jgi:hypothetical protein